MIPDISVVFSVKVRIPFIGCFHWGRWKTGKIDECRKREYNTGHQARLPP